MEVKDVIANKDVPVAILQRKIENAKTPEERERFEKEKFELLQGNEQVIKSMQQILALCTDSSEEVKRIQDKRSQAYTTKEYKEVSQHYKEKCFNWHETKYRSAMDHLYLFSNLLEEKVTVERLKNAIDEVGAAMKAEKEKETEQTEKTEQDKM